MMGGIRAFLARRHRKIVQVLSAALFNANVGGFLSGTIYRGELKKICVPGLNCYSCPGAVGSCPLGSLQASFNSFPKAVPMYVLGTLLVFGALFGRAICAFLCPFGLIQELLHKIPSRKIKKGVWTRRLTGIKYVVLAVFVLALPVYFLIRNGVVTPAFCKWLCPAGTLEGGFPLLIANENLRAAAGWLFSWKALVTVSVVALSVFKYRPFCRFLCPLGAIYSLFNRFALVGVRVDEEKCIHCGRCTRPCGMDVREVNDRECLRCGDCIPRCPTHAIRWKWPTKKEEKIDEKTARGAAGAPDPVPRRAGCANCPGADRRRGAGL